MRDLFVLDALFSTFDLTQFLFLPPSSRPRLHRVLLQELHPASSRSGRRRLLQPWSASRRRHQHDQVDPKRKLAANLERDGSGYGVGRPIEDRCQDLGGAQGSVREGGQGILSEDPGCRCRHRGGLLVPNQFRDRPSTFLLAISLLSLL